LAAPAVRLRLRPSAAGAGGPRYPAWLALPAVAWYVLFFLAPLGILAVFSFSEQVGYSGVAYNLNVRNYADLIDPLYGKIFLRTLELAGVGTLLTLLVGFPLAYYLARWARHKTLLLLLVIVPFWTSMLIRTYAWLILLDPAFLGHDFGILFTSKAVYIGVVYTYLPLMVLPVYAALERMDWSLVEAAQDLGDSPLQAFRRITLPLAGPGIVAGSLLVFIPMLGEYLNPVILGGDKTVYIGNLIGQQFLDARDWPFGAAIAMAVIASMTIVVLIYVRLVSRSNRHAG
jgi:spermidine/putrescine transport system permease protein